MRAHQIMTRPVTTVTPDTTIVEAANTMLQRHVSGLPVVDAAGQLVGIVSEGDFVRRGELGTQHKSNRPLLCYYWLSCVLLLRWVPSSPRRMKSPSETMPTSFPAASTTGEAAGVPLQHGIRCLDDRGVGRDGGDWFGHDLVGAPGDLFCFAILIIF